jgi:RNA-binding protein YhbY
MNGKERRNLKSIAKVRPVDLKIGKKGLTEAFLNEARKILSRDGMIKFSHSLVREERNDLVSKIEPLLSVNLVEKVGKTLTFSQVAQ